MSNIKDVFCIQVDVRPNGIPRRIKVAAAIRCKEQFSKHAASRSMETGKLASEAAHAAST